MGKFRGQVTDPEISKEGEMMVSAPTPPIPTVSGTPVVQHGEGGDITTFLYSSVGSNPEYGAPDRAGYVGVDPTYANHANDSDVPLQGSEDVPTGTPATAFEMEQQLAWGVTPPGSPT